MADRKLAKAVELTLQATLAVLKKQHPKRLVKVKAYDSTYLLAAILLHGFKWQCNVAVSKSRIMLGSRTFKHTRKADHPALNRVRQRGFRHPFVPVDHERSLLVESHVQGICSSRYSRDSGGRR